MYMEKKSYKLSYLAEVILSFYVCDRSSAKQQTMFQSYCLHQGQT